MHGRRSEDIIFWKLVLNTPLHPVVKAESLGVPQARWPENLSCLSLSYCLRKASITGVAFYMEPGGCLQVVSMEHQRLLPTG